MNTYDGCLPEVFRLLIAGASASGKSTLLCTLLENSNGILNKDFVRVIYLRGVETSNEGRLRDKFKEGLLVFDGIPPEEVLLPLCKTGVKTVLIIEDLDAQACRSDLISKVFTAYSHHYQFSVILSTQNIFRDGKERLTLVRNTTHIVLFPNNLDQTVVRHLAQNIHPKNPRKVIDLFEEVTQQPYGHLSFWSFCPKELKFRSHLGDNVQRIYDLD